MVAPERFHRNLAKFRFSRWAFTKALRSPHDQRTELPSPLASSRASFACLGWRTCQLVSGTWLASLVVVGENYNTLVPPSCCFVPVDFRGLGRFGGVQDWCKAIQGHTLPYGDGTSYNLSLYSASGKVRIHKPSNRACFSSPPWPLLG